MTDEPNKLVVATAATLLRRAKRFEEATKAIASFIEKEGFPQPEIRNGDLTQLGLQFTFGLEDKTPVAIEIAPAIESDAFTDLIIWVYQKQSTDDFHHQQFIHLSDALTAVQERLKGQPKPV